MDEPHESESRTIETSDVNDAAWLIANDVRFLRADKRRGPRVQFVFADEPPGVADRLIGAFRRDERLQRFIAARGRLAYVLRVARDSERTVIDADELARPRR